MRQQSAFGLIQKCRGFVAQMHQEQENGWMLSRNQSRTAVADWPTMAALQRDKLLTIS